jgi:hypothetical protein
MWSEEWRKQRNERHGQQNEKPELLEAAQPP